MQNARPYVWSSSRLVAPHKEPSIDPPLLGLLAGQLLRMALGRKLLQLLLQHVQLVRGVLHQGGG